MKNILLCFCALFLVVTLAGAQTDSLAQHTTGTSAGGSNSTEIEYMDQLDSALGPEIAATLAGLAIAAATFLISFTYPVAKKIQDYIKDGAQPNATDMLMYTSARKAVKRLMLSFYCFVAFLVESLTLDMWDEKGSLLEHSGIADMADILSSSGCLGAGLWLLGSGARMIGSIVKEE